MTAPPLDLDSVRGRAALPVWHPTGPSAAALLGLGRDGAYSAARRGDLPVVRVGRRLLVPVPALRRLLGDYDDLTTSTNKETNR